MKILSEQELAKYLDISKWTVRQWRLSGGLPHIQVGRRIFYRVEAVEHWMEKMEGKGELDGPDNGDLVSII